MDADPPTSRNKPTAVSERPSRLYRAGHRVVRMLTGLLTISVAVGGIVVLSALSRDQGAIRSCSQRVDYATRRFQLSLDASQPAPPSLPLPNSTPEDAASELPQERPRREMQIRDHYLYRSLFTLERDREEVGVVACARPHRLIFHRDGRHVVVYFPKARKFESLWLDEEEFQRRAARLGFVESVDGPGASPRPTVP